MFWGVCFCFLVVVVVCLLLVFLLFCVGGFNTRVHFNVFTLLVWQKYMIKFDAWTGYMTVESSSIRAFSPITNMTQVKQKENAHNYSLSAACQTRGVVSQWNALLSFNTITRYALVGDYSMVYIIYQNIFSKRCWIAYIQQRMDILKLHFAGYLKITKNSYLKIKQSKFSETAIFPIQCLSHLHKFVLCFSQT